MFKIKEYEDLLEYLKCNIIHLIGIPICIIYLARCGNLNALYIGFTLNVLFVGFIFLVILQANIGDEAANKVMGKITRCKFNGRY